MCNWNATGRETGAEIIVEDTMANDFFRKQGKTSIHRSTKFELLKLTL